MTPPAAAGHGRLLGMLLFGIAVVLLVSSPTWFAGDQPLVGGAQVLLGLVLAGVGVWLGRRSQRAG